MLSRVVSLSPEGLAVVEDAAYWRYQSRPDYHGEVESGLVANLPLTPCFSPLSGGHFFFYMDCNRTDGNFLINAFYGVNYLYPF